MQLSTGPHEFLYVHGAAGAEACMVAAWQPPGAGKPVEMPPEAFGSEQIGQYPSIGVKHLHEYAVDVAGEVPLAGNEVPLVRVQFRSISTRGSTTRPKVRWDFGDGQTSALADPVHIYLRPGVYTVAMKVSGESESLANINKVPIHRALIFPEANHQPDQLAAYLAILDKYDPAKLDPRTCCNWSGRSMREASMRGPPRPDRREFSPAASRPTWPARSPWCGW